MVSLEASIRSGNCFCCCCSAGGWAQRLELINTIKAVVLMVKEHTGSTTLTGWQHVAHAARHVCRRQTNQFASTAGGWRLSDAANGPADDACQVVLLGCE